jgi:hypothetical protein
MSKLALVLRELHRAETSLARDLLALADRHRVDHEVFHVARDIAGWSQIHVRKLAEVGAGYGAKLNPSPRWQIPAAGALSRRVSTALARRPETGLVLLADLRRVHRKAAGVSVDWELLAQAAQGLRHTDLLEVAHRCHPETLRQMRWANGKLKESATQALVS